MAGMGEERGETRLHSCESQRDIQAPVFANICVQKRLNRFTLRTKSKVDVQWKLFALVHNIGKIHTYGIGN
jgi:hypothetical protein